MCVHMFVLLCMCAVYALLCTHLHVFLNILQRSVLRNAFQQNQRQNLKDSAQNENAGLLVKKLYQEFQDRAKH